MDIGSFHFLTITNNVIMNICTQVFMWIYVLFLLDIILAAELLSNVVSLYLAIWEHARLFSKVAAVSCIPTSGVVYEESSSSVSSPTLGIICLFDDSHSSGGEMI